MSPLQLGILLHYYAAADDFRAGDFSAPAVREAIDTFRADYNDCNYEMAGMLTTQGAFDGQTYSLSDRGRFYIDGLLSVPLPVQVWQMPPTPGA